MFLHSSGGTVQSTKQHPVVCFCILRVARCRTQNILLCFCIHQVARCRAQNNILLCVFAFFGWHGAEHKTTSCCVFLYSLGGTVQNTKHPVVCFCILLVARCRIQNILSQSVPVMLTLSRYIRIELCNPYPYPYPYTIYGIFLLFFCCFFVSEMGATSTSSGRLKIKPKIVWKTG